MTDVGEGPQGPPRSVLVSTTAVGILVGVAAGFVVVTLWFAGPRTEPTEPTAPGWSTVVIGGWSAQMPGKPTVREGVVVVASVETESLERSSALDGVHLDLVSLDLADTPPDPGSAAHAVADGYAARRRLTLVEVTPAPTDLGSAVSFRCQAAEVGTCFGHVVVAGTETLIVTSAAADASAPAAATLLRVVAPVKRG